MEIIHRVDRQFDHSTIRPNGQAQLYRTSFERGVEIVAIDLQRLATGERSARVEFAAVGAGRKIPEQGNAKTARLFHRSF